MISCLQYRCVISGSRSESNEGVLSTSDRLVCFSACTDSYLLNDNLKLFLLRLVIIAIRVLVIVSIKEVQFSSDHLKKLE